MSVCGQVVKETTQRRRRPLPSPSGKEFPLSLHDGSKVGVTFKFGGMLFRTGCRKLGFSTGKSRVVFRNRKSIMIVVEGDVSFWFLPVGLQSLFQQRRSVRQSMDHEA
jgi:hypothetical protein